MEAGTLRSSKEGLCALCYTKASDKCSKCKQRWYCSPQCQMKDWLLGHKGDCGLGDLQLAAAPAPPPRMLRESVERPVLEEATWRRLSEQSLAERQPANGSGARSGLPRGLCNLGNNCYMNAVLQGLYHSSPVLFKACQQHRRCGTNGDGGETGALEPPCAPEAGCFRCDLDRSVSEALEHTVPEETPDSAFEVGVRVSISGQEGPNKRLGIVVTTPSPGTSGEDACWGVQFPGSGQVLSLPRRKLVLEGRAPSRAGLRDVTRWLPKLNAEFTFGMQEDAHEFLKSVLRLVEDEELKAHAVALRSRGEADGEAGAAAIEPNADLTATPKRMFGGIQVSQCTCTNRECGASTFAFEAFEDLALDITEATDSVEDALRYYTAPERFDKKNLYRCETCSEKVRARKQLTIYTPPPLLVLQLKRFRYEVRGKVTRSVEFGTSLNLRPFLCASTQEAGKPLIYELRAVVVHLDKAGYSHFGHYTAFVRQGPDSGGRSRWFLLDDSQVAEVTEEEVLSCRQQAYLLFYERAGGASAGADAGAAGRRVVQGGNSESTEAALPSKCRGRGGAVCSFFASADGLCFQCYQEEHGRPPPAPAAGSAGASPTAAAPTPAFAPPARPAATPKAAAASSKTKTKVGANDPCPCGSGKKYKKCHGAK